MGEAACAVLLTADAQEKAAAARRMAAAWAGGALTWGFPMTPPDRPARPERPRLLPPRDMPRRRSGGTLGNRIALLHAVAHIELNAIDLACDMVARFGGSDLPRAFCDDWVRIADDEARHFLMLSDRLHSLGAGYGALPAHDGLWQTAEATAHDLAARLAVVPLVLEARGLDVTPAMIERFERFGDPESAAALTVIHEEEISHVAAGKFWFDHLCRRRGRDAVDYFHALVRQYYKGRLKPPFNIAARTAAAFPRDFYEMLTDDG